MSRNRQIGVEPPTKRAKLENKPGYKFTSADEIRRSLRTHDQDSLIEALTALRNQLAVKSDEVISLLDERLLLALHWMELAPGAQELFEAWEASNQRQMSRTALFASVLASLLTLLSSHYTYQTFGQSIIKTLLSPPWMRRLNSNLGGSHNELILVTLKLLNAISAFASGRERKALLDAFAWETKVLSKLLFMKRKTKNDSSIDILVRPDIRALYVQFILSFVDQETSTMVKSAFLEQHRDIFLSIFKGIAQDPYPIIRKILEVCWAGIWSDQKIKRTLKINLFNESTIFQLIKLYDRVGPESADADHVPADLVHHFLLAICTRPGFGICFKDRGWYSRELDGDVGTTNGDDEPTTQRSGKIYNKILANILKALKVNEDSRQQELAVKIMTACPELVAGYWSGAALTLEPRLSSKWIANVSFFGTIIALPVPSSSFLLPASTLFQPSPPPLQTILENTLPSVNTKNNMSKGLQSTSSLVQHCTAIALAKCLAKYAEVVRIFHNVQNVLEEDEEDGQWCKRRKELEKEVRRRVPDFQVVVGFSQQKLIDNASQQDNNFPSNGQMNLTKAALLSESSQRLLWLYHQCLPSLVAEARFDVGKLLLSFTGNDPDETEHSTTARSDAVARFRTVRELHVLRLLKESDQFSWSGKSPSSPHSYLSILLRAYNATEFLATRLAITALLKKVLSDSILFQEDADEVYLWLDSLPTTRRPPGAESPDGAGLADESSSVIDFLDDCIQRCLKTPYRYLEERDVLVRSATKGIADDEQTAALVDHLEGQCSPLLITVLDQLGVKVASSLLVPSDVLAITSFIRKLVFNLSSKQRDLDFLSAFLDKLDAQVHPDLLPHYPNIMTAIRSEVLILRSCLRHLQSPQLPQPSTTSAVVKEFLSHVDRVPFPASTHARVTSAYELSDWVRLTNYALHPSELVHLASIIDRFHPPALREFFQNLTPSQGSVWGTSSIEPKLLRCLRFDWLFICTTPAILNNERNRDILVDSLFTHSGTLYDVQRAICLITHSLTSVRNQHLVQKDLLLLLTSIVQKGRTTLSAADFTSLKGYIFAYPHEIKRLFFSQSLKYPVREGLECLVDISLDPASDNDKRIAVEFGVYWMDAVKSNLASHGNIQSIFAHPWIRFLEPSDLFSLLSFVSNSVNNTSGAPALELLEAILTALRTSIIPSHESLGQRLTELLTLRVLLPNSPVLGDVIAATVNTCLPVAHHGRLSDGPIWDPSSLESFTTLAEMRWNHHLDPLPQDIDLQTFLEQKPWTGPTARTVSDLLYKQPSSREAYLHWLSTDHHTSVAMRDLAMTLYAYLDAAIQQDDVLVDAETEILASQFRHLLSSNCMEPSHDISFGVACLFLIIKRSGSKSTDLLSALLRHIQDTSNDLLCSEHLVLGRRLCKLFNHEAEEIITCIVDRSLQRVVRIFSSGTTELEDALKFTNELADLVKCSSHIKSHLAEPVVTVAIQNSLSNVNVLKFLDVLVQRAQLKPASVNRNLQNIVQHPQFFKTCVASAAHGDLRNTIVGLLLTLFNLHPHNTCQPSHVEPLVYIYGGTQSTADRQLLSIFQLFEEHRKTSVASIISRWSSSLDTTSSTPLEALLSLDSIRVLRTCLAYPTGRAFAQPDKYASSPNHEQIYDPVFVMLLFGQMCSHSPPASALAWVELFRTNVVSLLIRTLSHKDNGMRNIALCNIAALWKCLQVADMQERPHVLYILAQLKDTLPYPSDEPVRRLPTYSSLILLHALRGVFYPSNFIYPLTARFLLQRPQLDTGDVPMLYSMLYNSSDDWKKERGWIIRFLSDGMASTEDWQVLKRRHTWEILSSLFQSSDTDYALRNGILEVLANLTCNSQATTSLVLKSSLLTWIEMHLKMARATEVIAWIKIIENILIIGDPAKLEKSTGGEWRSTLCRCLLLVLPSDGPGLKIAVLVLAISATLRLSLLPGPSNPHLSLLVDRLLQSLKRFEKDMTLTIPDRLHAAQSQMLPLHGAVGLFETVSDHNPVKVWGEGVEALWQITMTLEKKSPAWDALTCRVLLWRAMVGEDGTAVGEWARTEVVRNLRTQ